MRIITYFIKYLVIILLLAVMIGFIGREVLLATGVSNLKKSLLVLKKSANQKSYTDQCQKKGMQIDDPDNFIFQLRFTTATEYVLEVVCGKMYLDPIVIQSSRALPKFVSKISNNAGIILSTQLSGVRLGIYGRTASVGIIDGEIVKINQNSALDLGPVSVCEGYGFNCCQPESQQGVGEQLTGVLSCGNTCYFSCVNRPMVLSFNSQPFPEKETRLVRTVAGQEVVFSYVVDAGLNNHNQVKINLIFGDGQIQALTTLQEMVGHVYRCNEANCLYTAKLEVQDQNGILAADLPIAKIKIMVSR